MIRVKCNIHGWMHAFIGVVDNPYFAVTGDDGTFELKNVPPGEYTIEAWQEELGVAGAAGDRCLLRARLKWRSHSRESR